MKTYALVGKSGTGKSFKAANLCTEMNIGGLIDDGLYVYNQSYFVGKSAKKDPTKVGAIKTALFSKDEHRDEIVAAIKKTQPNAVLILGTSDGMVEKIRERLKLPEIERTIYIEEITSNKERKIAYKERHGQGKHIVPVPSAQLKREFSGYFMAPIRMIKGLGFGRTSSEKTVVRPTYSYLGKFIISDRVIKDIIDIVSKDHKGVEAVLRVISAKHEEELTIDILAKFNKDRIVIEEACDFQRACAKKIEEMTAFSIDKLNIEVKGIV